MAQRQKLKGLRLLVRIYSPCSIVLGGVVVEVRVWKIVLSNGNDGTMIFGAQRSSKLQAAEGDDRNTVLIRWTGCSENDFYLRFETVILLFNLFTVTFSWLPHSSRFDNATPFAAGRHHLVTAAVFQQTC